MTMKHGAVDNNSLIKRYKYTMMAYLAERALADERVYLVAIHPDLSWFDNVVVILIIIAIIVIITSLFFMYALCQLLLLLLNCSTFFLSIIYLKKSTDF